MVARPEGLTEGTWTLDPSHSRIGFTVRHAGISKVRGNFEEFSGSLVVGDDLAFAGTIETASVVTGNEDRDNHLRSAEFFDAAQFPQITFRSTGVDGDTLRGDLTLHGVTRPVELENTFEGTATDPFGTYRAGFTASGRISRKEFGLTWNAALEAGGVLVSDEVRIDIEAEFVAPTAA